jgi:hypothetical protein
MPKSVTNKQNSESNRAEKVYRAIEEDMPWAAGFSIEENKLFILQEFLEDRFKNIFKNSISHLEEFYDLELNIH